MTFKNREEAGRRLVERLTQYRGDSTAIVLALPRGGTAVGCQLSLGLHLPRDVFIARKLGAPDNPEYALGAVGETGTIYLNPDAIAAYNLSGQEIEDLAQAQQQEIVRRQVLYRQGRQLPTLIDRTVILVDDGIATGATMRAALRAARAAGAARIVLAVPVAPEDALGAFAPLADEIVCLETPPGFYAVGAHYRDFTQVADAEVTEILDAAARA